MLIGRKCSLLIGLAILACTGPAFSQSTGRDGQPSWPPTPEQREQFYARMMERYMDRLGKAYRLDEAQSAQVRQRLEQLKAEHEAYAAPLRSEFEAAVREWGEMRRQRSAGQQVDGQRYEQLRTRMREMWQGSPFMNPTRVVNKVEELLPADQVERGRKHRAEILGEWQRRREGGERSRGDDEGRSPRGDTGRSRSGDVNSRERRSETSPIEAPTADRWKQYVEDFGRKYQFDASQRSTADSLLRTAIEQRDAYQKSHQSDFAAAGALQDPTERVQRMKSLNEPMREYFEQLKSGLEKIPTSAQRQAVEPAPVAQSQPSTAPSGSRSRLRHSSRR